MGPSYLGTTASYDRVIGRAPFDTVVGGGWVGGGARYSKVFFIRLRFGRARTFIEHRRQRNRGIYILPLFLPFPLRTRLVYSC